jgi:Holliday junction resolvase RusA-like endonuclease
MLYPRDKRLLDIDNVCKAILDSMNGILYTDDQQVWKLSVERGEKIKGGGCEVTIKEYSKHDQTKIEHDHAISKRILSLIEDLND